MPKDTAPPLPFDAVELATDISARLRTHPIVEVGAGDYDMVLRGLLRVLCALVERVPSLASRLGTSETDGGLGIVDFVYDACLFH